MKTERRNFLKKASVGAIGIVAAGITRVC